MKISIDIGTSYSCCFAQLPNGEVSAVKVSTGISAFGSDTSMPSAVFRTQEGKELLGQAAMNCRLINPASFCKEFKRNLGQTVSFTLGNKTYSPQDLYTLFFSHMRDRIYDSFPGADLDCYLTCPVNFTENQRKLVRAAAQNAGLFNTTLIDEPVAAVQGCRSLPVMQDGDKILVYDFGGGTFDVAIVEYIQGSYRVVRRDGISNCGGSNIDRLICQDILKKVSSEQMARIKEDPVADSRFILHINEMAVKAKHQLSDSEVFSDCLLLKHYTLDYTLRIEDLEKMIANLVAGTIQCCRTLLQSAGLAPQDLTHVLLVGGTSRIPYVKQKVRELAGTVPVTLAEDPELTVARGALFHDVSQDAWKMYQQGLKSEKQNQPIIAFGCYQQAAQAGIAEAQYALAKLYQAGVEGLMKPDSIQAEHWYHQAALQDHLDAMYRLAESFRVTKSHPEEAYLDWYQKAAEKGHAEAQFQMGMLSYLYPEKLEYWVTQAANQGYAAAQEYLGYLYGIHYHPRDIQKAIYWYTKAADQGETESIRMLGVLYHRLSDYPNAVKWFLPLAQQGHEQACEYIGWYCEQGIVLDKSRENARKWYLRAAAGGNDHGWVTKSVCYRLGVFYESEGDFVTAAEWYRKVSWNDDNATENAACALAQLYWRGKIPDYGARDAKKLLKKLVSKQPPYPEAVYLRGLYFEEGAEGAPDLQRARTWYYNAALSNHKIAQYKYACMLLEPKDETENPAAEERTALEHLEKSAKQGYVPALNRYGRILAENDEWDKAEACFRQSIEQGDPEGIYCLACCYNRRSDDNAQDREKAAALYLQAAENGYAMAQYVVAKEYRHEISRKEYLYPRDDQKYLYWCRKAAEQGHQAAQNELYQMYSTGKTAKKDEQEAEKWLREMAKEDGSAAQLQLAQLLKERDPEESLFWYRKAAENGNSDARLYLADHCYGKKQYAEACAWYEKVSNIRAYFTAGELYEKGLGVKKNSKTAADYYEKVCIFAYSWDESQKPMIREAAYRLARYYECITFPFSKKKQAEEWYRKAAEAGHEGAQQWLKAHNL